MVASQSRSSPPLGTPAETRTPAPPTWRCARSTPGRCRTTCCRISSCPISRRRGRSKRGHLGSTGSPGLRYSPTRLQRDLALRGVSLGQPARWGSGLSWGYCERRYGDGHGAGWAADGSSPAGATPLAKPPPISFPPLFF
jgi:hypothetical protein